MTIAYSAVFCGLGLRVRRALAWGLAYLLIWEQAVARVSHGAARASIFVNTRSLAAYVAHHSPPKNAVAWTTGLIVPAGGRGRGAGPDRPVARPGEIA